MISATMCNLFAVLLPLWGTIISNLVYGSPVIKRGIFDDAYDAAVHPDFGNPGLPQEFNNFPGSIFPIEQPPQHQPLPFVVRKIYSTPSPAEIAAAVSAAKEASANVMAAQERVQIAKEDVINQQKIASHKEVQAALALQQTEAAAAIQRQQASAAANAVVMAQQRLAHAKADVSEQQRVASEKESAAASAIQRSAAAAAEKIKKTESAAAKIAAFQSSEAAAVLKQVTAAKDATLSATSAAVAAAVGHGPIKDIESWLIPEKVAHFAPWG